MSEMVERVAKAFCESNKDDWDKLNHLQKVCLITNATAAIEAMREPTDSQRAEFYKMKLAEGHTRYSSCFQDADWNRAIDAALK